MAKFAAIQLNSGQDVDVNLLQAEELIKKAVSKVQADCIVLPEMFPIMGKKEQDKLAVKEPFGHGPIQDFLQSQAKKHNCWIIGGTIPLDSNDHNKIRAACLVYDNEGNLASRYDKIHLFDVCIEDGKEHYQESLSTEAGTESVCLDSPFGKIGLSVCYDIRFPELYRQLINQQAQILSIPSAFTQATGKAHWHTLVKARAIENLSYVITACQVGEHPNQRSTYGHSMIVDPWGNILAELAEGEGYIAADIDLEKQTKLRTEFPCLNNRRL